MNEYFSTTNNNPNNNLNCVSFYHLTNTCIFDFDRESIFNKDSKSEIVLSKRENLFLKLLLNNKTILTYSQMDRYLSVLNKRFTSNAKRSFIKNLRKKLPENIILNISQRGYRLNI